MPALAASPDATTNVALTTATHRDPFRPHLLIEKSSMHTWMLAPARGCGLHPRQHAAESWGTSPSPIGSAPTAGIATTFSNPSRRASMSEFATQKSVASPHCTTRESHVRADTRPARSGCCGRFLRRSSRRRRRSGTPCASPARRACPIPTLCGRLASSCRPLMLGGKGFEVERDRTTSRRPRPAPPVVLQTAPGTSLPNSADSRRPQPP